MAITLTVETGTGSATANSYLSRADADTYWADRGDPAAWSGLTDAQKDLALFAATQAIDLRYRTRFRGERYSTTQALEFPTDDIYAWDCLILAAGTMPQELKDATAELALRWAIGDKTNGANPLIPDESARTLKSHTVETKDKRESWSWDGAGGTKADPDEGSITSYAIVDQLLAKFLHSGPVVGRA